VRSIRLHAHEPSCTCDGAVHGPLLLSVTEVADLLGIHRATVYDLLATGQLRSTTLGRRRLIPRAAVEEFVALLERRAEREAAENRAVSERSGGFDD
jgi:excisionase family DNA binding protein